VESLSFFVFESCESGKSFVWEFFALEAVRKREKVSESPSVFDSESAGLELSRLIGSAVFVRFLSSRKAFSSPDSLVAAVIISISSVLAHKSHCCRDDRIGNN
jgi:hypothetical protein